MSGSRALSAFLVELGAAMMVASTMVPVLTLKPRSLQLLAYLGKQGFTQFLLIEQFAKLQQRGGVGHAFAARSIPQSGADWHCHTEPPRTPDRPG